MPGDQFHVMYIHTSGAFGEFSKKCKSNHTCSCGITFQIGSIHRVHINDVLPTNKM